MKKVFVTIALTVVSFAIFAGTPKANAVELKTVTLTKTFNRVSVGENLNVEFSNAANASIRLEGNNSFVNGVNFQVINGTLFVSLKGKAKIYKGTIYLPVGNLIQVDINTNSKVCSHEFLNCNDLTVFVAEGARAELKTKGMIAFKSLGECALDFEKNVSISE